MANSTFGDSLRERAALPVSSEIAKLLFACGSEEAVMPPTALFNEGWMLRLVLSWFSNQPASDHPLAFLPGARWYSEGLLRSQFRARWRGDPLAEAWTHADAIIGHFRVRAGRGDVELHDDAKQLVITEAKLYSALSPGTSRAPTFNQAARNVACMAELIGPRTLASFDRLSFVLLAPAQQIERGVFGQFCERVSISECVQRRVTGYDGQKEEWFRVYFLPALDAIAVKILAWETVISYIARADPVYGGSLSAFYQECVAFNGGDRSMRSIRRPTA